MFRKTGILCLCLMCLVIGVPFLSATEPDDPDGSKPWARLEKVSAEKILEQLKKKYKSNLKKYRALEKKIKKSVDAALAKAMWRSGPAPGIERPVKEHPLMELVDRLSDAALESSDSKNDQAEKQKLFDKNPWGNRLELVLGLEFGSDRPIPDHKNGFINLGEAPEVVAGYPELLFNRYMFAFQEIVGWQFGVKQSKSLNYDGRKKVSRKKTTMALDLPPWEGIRLYLKGIKPEVPLFAIPWLTHEIHSEMVDLRRSEMGELSYMDEVLAFKESKWNGFFFKDPYSRKIEAFVQPVHALYTEKGGFVFRFPVSRELAARGDLPFVSDTTYQSYADRFLGLTVSVGDLVRDTQDASTAKNKYMAESTYLARYKCLIDLIVRAVLTPSLDYPQYLNAFDYQEGKRPTRDIETVTKELDMPRKHALLVWAFANKEPIDLARLLHEELLVQEANRFSNDVSLPVQFTIYVRKNEERMVEAVINRIKTEREGGEARSGAGLATGDFEREFSPFLQKGEVSGIFHSDYLAASYHSFQQPAEEAVRAAALECVFKEIGDKWLK